jgi:F0F1-type ATP synthase membrane subunit b/b'
MSIEIIATTIVAVVTVFGFFGGAVNYIVIKPLANGIKALQLSIDKFAAQIERQEDRQRAMDNRLSVVETKVDILEHK